MEVRFVVPSFATEAKLGQPQLQDIGVEKSKLGQPPATISRAAA